MSCVSNPSIIYTRRHDKKFTTMSKKADHTYSRQKEQQIEIFLKQLLASITLNMVNFTPIKGLYLL